MIDDPTPPPASANPAAPANPPSSRRPLVWAALGALALGVAGGGVAATALADAPGPDRLTADAAQETGLPAQADGDEEGTADEDAAGCHRMGRHAAHGAHGTVTGVEGGTVTVEDGEGTATTVTTDDETTVRDVAAGEVADVAEGDTVVVTGETADDDTVTARRLVDLGSLDPDDLPPGRPGRPGGPWGDDADDPDDEDAGPDAEGWGARFRPAVGTVAAVDGATITVATDDGDVAVTTTDETAVTVVTEIGVADLAEGDTIAVRGETADDGTVAADAIIRGDLDEGGLGFGPGFGWGGPGRRGVGGHRGGR